MNGPQTISLWDRSELEPDPQNPLRGDAQADVAIVGAGYTGLSTALHCAQKGLTARVLEANRIGHGGSGRNVGLVNAGVWLPPAKIRAHLGETYGPRFLARFGAAPQLVFDLIEAHQIRCEATRSGTIHAAHAASGLAELRSRHAAWSELGAPVTLLDRAEVAALTGTERFHGGLLDRRCGTINPMAYCRGLARAAHAAGAEIHTGTRVTALRRDDGVWQVETNRGSVTARAVVLGTNAYTGDLWPGLKQVFTTIDYFQLSTPPLGPEASHILPGRQGLWDTGRIMCSLRRDAEGRLVIGSMGRIIGSAVRGLSRRWAQKRIAQLFPGLGPVEFEQAWHGQIAMTPDHMPRIHALAPDLYAPIGYNGRGITTGTLFGQSMAELLTGMDPRELPLPMSEPSIDRAAPLMRPLYRLAFAANQILKAL